MSYPIHGEAIDKIDRTLQHEQRVGGPAQSTVKRAASQATGFHFLFITTPYRINNLGYFDQFFNGLFPYYRFIINYISRKSREIDTLRPSRVV